jgi:hypothetical protein
MARHLKVNFRGFIAQANYTAERPLHVLVRHVEIK